MFECIITQILERALTETEKRNERAVYIANREVFDKILECLVKNLNFLPYFKAIPTASPGH